jgi:adenylate kinase family enzyme
MKAKKIIIFGTRGSGKTIFAKRLSKKIKIPSFDLDNITFNKEHTSKVSDSTRDKRLKSIIKKQKWIIEGAYAGNWLIPAVKKADLIMILKINGLIAAKRVIFRFIKRRKTKDKKSGLKDLPRILKYSLFYDYFPRHIQFSKTYKKSLIILRNNREINNFLNNLR